MSTFPYKIQNFSKYLGIQPGSWEVDSEEFEYVVWNLMEYFREFWESQFAVLEVQMVGVFSFQEYL